MLKYPTYAENVRAAAKTKNNAQGRPLHIRELAQLTGYSYEHIRKIWRGQYTENNKFSVSEDCNIILCDVLGLHAEQMWDLAQREKFAQKAGYIPMQLEDPQGRELSDLWETMNQTQHAMILEIARSMAGAHANR
jgi:hypothetical protein